MLQGVDGFSSNLVNEQLLEDLLSPLPRDVKVPPREEACDRMPSQVMDPSPLSQLNHNGIDPGEAGPTLAPGCKVSIIVLPVNLTADRVA